MAAVPRRAHQSCRRRGGRERGSSVSTSDRFKQERQGFWLVVATARCQNANGSIRPIAVQRKRSPWPVASRARGPGPCRLAVQPHRPPLRRLLALHRPAQDQPHLLLHAAAMTLGPPLQRLLHRRIEIAHQQLGHGGDVWDVDWDIYGVAIVIAALNCGPQHPTPAGSPPAGRSVSCASSPGQASRSQADRVWAHAGSAHSGRSRLDGVVPGGLEMWW